jgi:ribosome recycling factor
MTMSDFSKPYEEKMQKTISVLQQDYGAIRAGRANPAILDKVMVPYYGVPTPINQMATVSVSEARILTITPWDRTQMKAIEKAIQTSDVGINPQNDGSTIRLVFPPLNEERRKELSKQISKIGENSKVAIRSIRRDANEKLKTAKKNSEMPEDTITDLEEQMQKLTDKYCKEIDEIAALKVKEIMEV